MVLAREESSPINVPLEGSLENARLGVTNRRL